MCFHNSYIDSQKFKGVFKKIWPWFKKGLFLKPWTDCEWDGCNVKTWWFETSIPAFFKFYSLSVSCYKNTWISNQVHFTSFWIPCIPLMFSPNVLPEVIMVQLLKAVIVSTSYVTCLSNTLHSNSAQIW